MTPTRTATKYGAPGVIPPHRPVHTVFVSTCGTCGYLIGWREDSDPMHAVPGECRCGTNLPAFKYQCLTCEAEQRDRLERERLARVATYVDGPVFDDDGTEPERRNRDHADPFEGDPVRKARHQEAVAYIAGYTGRFALILDLRANPKWGTKWFRLSDRQVEVVLKSKEREAQWERDRAEAEADARRRNPETGRDLTVLPYGRTRAAVENESGGLTFLLIDRPDAKSNWHGWVFVKQQQGPSEVKLGAQRPGSTYVGQWPGLIDKVLADPLEAVRRYGLELGVCGVCGLPLTNEESRREGIGPVCRSRIAA